MQWDRLGLAGRNCLAKVKRVTSLCRRRLADAIPSQVEHLEQRLVLTPTSDEQLFVYLLNKIRHDPQAYDTQANLGSRWP
jgi:hypothetical protein